MILFDGKDNKIARSENYNFIFNKNNGQFARWGRSYDDDPKYAPTPEILDLEITTSCKYVCPWCYKSNNPNGKYMTFETFKIIFDKIYKNKVLTQIAFGVDAHCKTNPDVWKIMDYTKQHGVIPNVTVAELDDETADNIAKYCGACSVSEYDNVDICYNTVKKLTDRGMTQVNIHKMLCKERFIQSINLIDSVTRDERLKKLNAVVFLSLKQKGRGVNFNRIEDMQFLALIKHALENKINFGFDSCTAPKFLKTAKILNIYDKVKDFVEPCESSLFSSYINVEGKFFPCSFSEGEGDWIDGIDVVNCDDFVKDVWNNEKTIAFRNSLITEHCGTCRQCPLYNI